MNIDRDEAFDIRVDALTAQICDLLDRDPNARRILVNAESDDDYDLFEAVAARLFDQCGVLAVHAMQTTPLVFEIGPRARDVWGPAIAQVLDDPAGEALLDTHAIYEQTAQTWRNLLRLQPLSMTPYEERLMVRLAEDMALARGLTLEPVDRHRFHVHAPRAAAVYSDRTDWVNDYLDLDEGNDVPIVEDAEGEYVFDVDGGDNDALWSWQSVLV
ncbi:hypothetical protein pqer_cds_798 [Pandoravirus quercus]|uniref:DUF5878 domain-containing protein n=1 Tax=Pandoravirus quercus TaxID=2107709 RepID=A0A2U7UA16_9VIRU|nr:hypothetical protein pqer_cds_798 [Pandoravirus quercus]AVK75220.1 hypothetical protein pqer_cds_798 [Pandoravirus quercus]